MAPSTSAQIHEDILVVFAVLVIATPIFLFAILRNYVESMTHEESISSGGSMRNLLKFSGANSLIGLGAGFIIPLIATWFFLKFGVPNKCTATVGGFKHHDWTLRLAQPEDGSQVRNR